MPTSPKSSAGGEDSTRALWVVGASSGIGRAVAEAGARRGYDVLLASRRMDELVAMADRCSALGSADSTIVALDVTDRRRLPEAVRLFLAGVRDRRLARPIVVFAAGVSQRSPAVGTAESVHDLVMETNFEAPRRLIVDIVPRLAEAGGGQVIALGSLAGEVPTPMRSSYGAAKAALASFCRSVDAEVRESGVRVRVVEIGFVRTDIARNAVMGDGSRSGRSDRNQDFGLNPEVVAERILHFADQQLVYTTVALQLKGRIARALARHFPEGWSRVSRIGGRVGTR